MGDRAIIHVKDSACSAYLHWDGASNIELLNQAIPTMRYDDPDYSQARLIGVLHNAISGNSGLGVMPPPSEEDYAQNMLDYSHGDAGVIIYDCKTGELQVYNGYLEHEDLPTKLDIPPE